MYFFLFSQVWVEEPQLNDCCCFVKLPVAHMRCEIDTIDRPQKQAISYESNKKIKIAQAAMRWMIFEQVAIPVRLILCIKRKITGLAFEKGVIVVINNVFCIMVEKYNWVKTTINEYL